MTLVDERPTSKCPQCGHKAHKANECKEKIMNANPIFSIFPIPLCKCDYDSD